MISGGVLATLFLLASQQVLGQPERPEASYDETPRVVPLVEGVMYPTEKGYVMASSITLVLDQGYAIVVDSPSANDQHSKDLMLKGLNELGISPAQIHVAVTTHGHPDHFGQGNIFTNARHLFGPYDYVGSSFNRNELFTQNEMLLTKHVELWNTPGHTNQDVSVIVKRVPGIGTIGVVGDLFYSELDALSGGEEWGRDAWNSKLGLENRRRVLCACDAIVPGHSRIFRVTSEMKLQAGCQLSQPLPPSIQINQINGPIQPLPEQHPVQPIQPVQPVQVPQQPQQPHQFVNPNQLQQLDQRLAQQLDQRPVQQLDQRLAPQLDQRPIQHLGQQSIQQFDQRLAPHLDQRSAQTPRRLEQLDAIQPSLMVLPKEALSVQRSEPQYGQNGEHPAQAQQTGPVQSPILNNPTPTSLEQSVFLPVLDAAASHLANYLTAAQPGAPVPIPQHMATEVRTYPVSKH